jgi:hypothetical protein
MHVLARGLPALRAVRRGDRHVRGEDDRGEGAQPPRPRALSRDEPGRAQVAGILAARETPFWLAFLAATCIYRQAGRKFETDDSLPEDVTEDVDVDQQFYRFLRFANAGSDGDDDPRRLSLFEGMGYRLFLVDKDFKLIEGTLVQRAHAVLKEWPDIPTTRDECVDVKAKWGDRVEFSSPDDLYKHIVARAHARRRT